MKVKAHVFVGQLHTGALELQLRVYSMTCNLRKTWNYQKA